MNSTTEIHNIRVFQLAGSQNPDWVVDPGGPKKEKRKQKFNQLIAESVDSALAICCGPSREIIYNYMLKKYGLTKELIPEYPEIFSQVLESIFGQAALLIEARILENIHAKRKKYRHFSSNTKFNFASYLADLRDSES